MASISERDSKVIWHPYTPMKIWPEAIAIKRGEGAYLIDEQGNRYLDAVSSWWVNLHGHSHPYIAARVSEQLRSMEHCMFAGFTHEPAVALAERLLQILPGPMNRIFYSDNGSTAVEVAIKMALQYFINTGNPRKRIVALENAYHGDTFGAMAVSGRSVFNATFSDYLFDVSFVPFPYPGKEAESVAALRRLLAAGDVAAFIVEPLIQGSAGMYMYSAEVLEQFFALCKEHGTLIIDDEVMTGFGRTGPLFAADRLATGPDMVCLSKGLTGGTMPMGITAATSKIFDAFWDDDRSRMLYHGHSFTANATSCAASLASLDLLLADSCTEARGMIETEHTGFAAVMRKHPLVADVRHTGTIIALEINAGTTSYHSNIRDRMYRYFLSRNVILRPLGNIVYILPPYCITKEELQYIYSCITDFLSAEAGTQ